MYLLFHDEGKDVMQISFNNQNYIPPIPNVGDFVGLQIFTDRAPFHYVVKSRKFFYSEIGIEGVGIQVVEVRL